MRWFPAALLSLLACAPAAAGEFSGVPGLAGELEGIRAGALRLRFENRSVAPAAVPEAAPVPDAVPDVSSYPVRGMDISHYQDDVDWAQVKTAGLSFVYIKATEGTDLADDMFKHNWQGASEAGLLKGAYHFYNFCAGGAAQADFFIKNVPATPGALPPTVDLERSSSCTKLPSRASFRKSLAAFTAKIKAAYGRKPVLYTNSEIYGLYLQGDSAEYRIWFTDIHNTQPQLPEQRAWTFWQYSFKGRVPGVPGPVDLDVYRETPEALAALTLEENTLLALR